MDSKFILTAAILSVLLAFTATSILEPPKIAGSIDQLSTAEIIPLVGATGPESLAFDPNGGGPYTGVADGRILKWEGHGKGWVDFATSTSQREECFRPFAPQLEHICGRPLGLRFNQKNGDLYIADAYLGLLVVGATGGLATPLVTEVQGAALRFTNDMDIDEHEAVIYFTDSSTVFYRRQFIALLLSGDKTGRLMKYDIARKEVTVLLRGLAFANGVVLSKDHSFVLVAETSTCRIMRYWLRGPNSGKHDVFAKLPGFPDNIRRSSEGGFWVALHSKLGVVSELATSNRSLGKALLKLPISMENLHHILVGGPHATAIKLSEEGKVLEVLEDAEGKRLRFISEVDERQEKLWIASVMTPFLGVYNLSQTGSNS